MHYYLFAIVVDYALIMAIEGHEEEFSLHLVKRRSRRVGPDVVTDLDLADDSAFILEEIDQAQELLKRVETFSSKRLNSG